MMLGATLGCAPDLIAGCDATGCASAASELVVTSEPEAPSDAVPAILRLHVVERQADGAERAPIPLDPTRVVLVRGQLGRAQLAELARGEPSAALQARFVPALAWSADDGHVVLAPSEGLVPGERYTIGCAGPRLAAEISVALDDPLPRLERLWPPLGRSSSASTGVWCGAAALPGRNVPTQLLPSGVTGTLATGALDDGIGVQCLRFSLPPAVDGAPPSDPAAGSATVAAPAWPSTGPDALVRLDPRPLTRDAPVVPLEPRPCALGELPLGPGCARIADDRLWLAPPAAPQLWSILGGGLDVVATTGIEPGGSLLIHPLPMDSPVELDVAVADTAGTIRRSVLRVHTLPPMAHVVLNEVLANPNGPEPEQEWVELYNDGHAPAALAGYALLDAGGYSLLPSATLAPGAFALVVNEDYDAASEFDPPPVPGTLLVRVPKLGTHGLSNSGEPLELRDASGATVSLFPAEPGPEPGRSVMRIEPEAPDGLASSFGLSPGAPTPGGANGPAG
jgi:hypothetical protein